MFHQVIFVGILDKGLNSLIQMVHVILLLLLLLLLKYIWRKRVNLSCTTCSFDAFTYFNKIAIVGIGSTLNTSHNYHFFLCDCNKQDLVS